MAIQLTWARRRQITILTCIGILIVALFGAGFYYIFDKPATCSDGIQDQNETGVDCGGICSRICPDATKDAIVDWVKIFKIRDGVYSAVARLENPNDDTIASNVPYEFTLSDSSGNILAKRDGTTFIPSHSSFIIFEGTISIPSGIPENVNFQLTQAPDWQKSTYVEPAVTITDKQLTDADTLPRLDATLENRNISDINNLTLYALIYDDQGNVVQVSQTKVDSIKAEATANVTFTWPLPISLKSRECESPVDTSLVIDRSGSMAFVQKNPPEPLTDIKDAADSFVDELSPNDQVAVVSFSNTASTPADQPLTGNFTSAKSSIDAISIQSSNIYTQNTNIGDGLLKGGKSFFPRRIMPRQAKC